jgi:ribosomal protein L22
VNGKNLRISTKYSAAICRFIRNKKIEDAIEDLEKVLTKKKAVPVKGEIPHRKGPGKIASGSGKYPKNATENFIKLLKILQANANYNELENPIIAEAIANIGERPYGRFGRVRRKRTHVKIIAKEKKANKKINKKKR